MKQKPALWRQLRSFAVECARTERRLENVYGPKPPGKHWRHIASEYYDSDDSPKIKIRATPQQITELDAFDDFINQHQIEIDRVDVRRFCRMHIRGRGSFTKYYKRNNISKGQYEWRIQTIFQTLAQKAGCKRLLTPEIRLALVQISGNSLETSQEPSPNHWRSLDTSFPKHLGTMNEQRARTVNALSKRMQERSR